MSDDPRRNLLARMREIRSKLDPKILERARLAVFGKVPYDHDAALAAVARFLESRDDDDAFRRELEAALTREGADARTLLAPLDRPEPAPDGGGKKPKWRRIGRIV